MDASSQDSEVCSNPDLLRRPHSDSSASLSNSGSEDSEGDDSDSATQSEGGGHQHSSSSRKTVGGRARTASSARVKRAPSNSGKVFWTDEMVGTTYKHVKYIQYLLCMYVLLLYYVCMYLYVIIKFYYLYSICM